MSGSDRPFIIVGGGLAGCLTALALRRTNPDIPLLLIEEREALAGNHIWSCFDSDISAKDRWLIEPAVIARWPSYEVRFPRRKRILKTGYNSLSSDRLADEAARILAAGEILLGCPVERLDGAGVTMRDGRRIEGRAVIDARGAAPPSGLRLAWQKFVGRVIELDRPHGLDRPIVMDAAVEQVDGYRFVYCLPFSDRKLLVEDTYYSTDPALDESAITARIDEYLEARGWAPSGLGKVERGVLPIVISGELSALWPEDGVKVPRIGMRGGFFHPTTGYSLPDAVRVAMVIARNAELDSAALAKMLRAMSESGWRRRSFDRMLNKLLFDAAAPGERYRVLEHFYRLDQRLIERFYAGRVTMVDKLRILSGKPPVSLLRAIGALTRHG